MMYGSKFWVLNKRDETKMEVPEIRIGRWICGLTRLVKIRNEYKRGSLKMAGKARKLREKS